MNVPEFLRAKQPMKQQLGSKQHFDCSVLTAQAKNWSSTAVSSSWEKITSNLEFLAQLNRKRELGHDDDNGRRTGRGLMESRHTATLKCKLLLPPSEYLLHKKKKNPLAFLGRYTKKDENGDPQLTAKGASCTTKRQSSVQAGRDESRLTTQHMGPVCLVCVSYQKFWRT